MSGQRITQKDAEQALRVYCTRAGLPFGHYANATGKAPGVSLTRPTDQVGTITQSGRTFLAHRLYPDGDTFVITGGLALSGAYSGYQVHQIIGLDGTDPNRDGRPCTGVRTPFGGGYQSARSIVTMLNGAITALEMAEVQR